MFIIYHIKGIKVGCTERWPQRIYDQGYTLDQAEILAETDSINHASKMEQRFQEEYGYSECDSNNYLHMRDMARKSKTPSAIKKQSASMKGKIWSEEHKAKISKAHKGKIISEEHARSISKSRKGIWVGQNHPTYGRGNLYKELSTGFVGYASDHEKEFGMKGIGIILNNIKTNKPISKGPNKGKQWIVVDSKD